MPERIDYSLLDLPDVNRVLFYPQRYWTDPPPGSYDFPVPLAGGINLSGRFHPLDKGAPTVLLFHGNGEIACQYDGLAPLYHQAGANLAVVDYRGYGASGGRPSISTLMGDAHDTWAHFGRTLAGQGYSGPRFVKGRSLGSQPALEIAAHHGADIAGLIIESGFSGTERLFGRFAEAGLPGALQAVLGQHRQNIRSITAPMLIIHGEMDDLVPLEMAVELYDAVSSPDKEMVVIPRAGHNDLLAADPRTYFDSIRRFLERHGG